jgi:hypothetical protein
MSEKKKFLLRVDAELFEVYEKWAADELRSVNAQIEYVLANKAKDQNRLQKKDNRKPPENTMEE